MKIYLVPERKLSFSPISQILILEILPVLLWTTALLIGHLMISLPCVSNLKLKQNYLFKKKF